LLTYPSGSAEAFENGERSGRHGEAIWQLQHPTKENPTYLMNAKLQLPDNSRMRVPTSVLSKRTPHGDLIFGANLTPRYTIVDLHIDQGRDGLIVCVKDSKKIVLMWPATNLNMNLLQECSYHQANLVRVGSQLEGGIAVMADSSKSLIMYSGTIHATITLESGILVGINWVSVESYRPAFRCFAYEMTVDLESDFGNILGILVLQLEASLQGLDHTGHEKVISDWVDIYTDLVSKCAKRSTKNVLHQLEKLRTVFEEFFTRNPTLQIPCCSSTDSFQHHFRLVHLKDLCPPMQGGGRSSTRRKLN